MKYLLLSALVFVSIILNGCSSQNFQTVSDESSFVAAATFDTTVDILWVVDNSFSTMEIHQNRIAREMQDFYDGLLQTDTDFRVAATTMDVSTTGAQGDLQGPVPVVTRSTPNAVARLQELLRRGGDGNNSEVGLGAMRLALEKQESLGSSANFLRDEALLVVVFVTDDRDFSLGPVSDFKSFLDGLKGENTVRTQNWVANYIGVTDLNDPNCRTFGDYSARGDRYIELVQGSGGIAESICESDFSSYLDQVTVRLRSVLNRYKLRDTPLLDSLTVYKNGVLVRQDDNDGWSYDETTNTVTLNGASQPGPNDRIEIEYEIKAIGTN